MYTYCIEEPAGDALIMIREWKQGGGAFGFLAFIRRTLTWTEESKPLPLN